MIPILAAALILLSPQLQDQKTSLGKSRVAAPSVNTVVTEGDALLVFRRAEQLLRHVTASKAVVSPIKLQSSNRPADRQKLIGEFARLYNIAKPAFKVIPSPVAVNMKVINASDPDVRARLLLLVKRGAVANYGTLAAGPANSMTIRQFGDAVGFFLARMAQMTDMPNSEFTPGLTRG
jgi:hypothetical protein